MYIYMYICIHVYMCICIHVYMYIPDSFFHVVSVNAAPKSERLMEVWTEIRTMTEDLQEERQRLQGKWLRGVRYLSPCISALSPLRWLSRSLALAHVCTWSVCTVVSFECPFSLRVLLFRFLSLSLL